MLSFSQIIVHLTESAAITGAIYLVTKKKLVLREVVSLVLTISVSFMVLDLFAPRVATGARQGSGFGLGFKQFAGDGNTMPRQYYEDKPVVEGMDDPVAVDYYGKYNPPNHVNQEKPMFTGEHPIFKTKQIPSIILQEYTQSPFESDTEKHYATAN